MDSLLAEQIAAEKIIDKRKAKLAEDDAQLATKRARMIEWQDVRNEKMVQIARQRDAGERIMELKRKEKAFELEFLHGDSAGQTDTVSMFKLPPSPDLAEYLATGTNHPSRSHQETSEDEITAGFSPSQSRKTPLGRHHYSYLDEGEAHPASRILPRNMLVFKGTESANMSDIWTVCCARQKCRTNMTSHGEILKGAKGVCLHARACHYATWKPIFEGKSDQIKLFGENPDWCEWYHLTKAEVEDWRLSGQLPKQVVPRAAATVFEKSKPPTQKFCIDEAY